MGSLSLAPGSYVITANGWAQGKGPGTATARCGIGPGSSQQVGVSLPTGLEGSLASTLPVSVAATTTYELTCYRLTADDIQLLRSQLTAIKVGSVTSQ
jgi:hypothetical protein